MKIVKILIALPLMIGIPIPIISTELLNNQHSILFAPLSIVFAFVGTALIYGISDFKQEPRCIGNLDKKIMPVINQNWMIFFITLIINLLVANLCGTFLY